MNPAEEQGSDEAPLVRPFVISDGRALPDGRRLELITLVTTTQGEQSTDQLPPEKRSLLQLCAGGFLSVAEISGHLDLPLNIIKVLLSDLIDDGYLVHRPPVPPAQLVDSKTLREVLNGLEARFG